MKKSTKKKKAPETPKKLRNSGANKIISERPRGSGKRLTQAEKLMIISERQSGKPTMKVAERYGVSHSTVIELERNVTIKAMLEEADAAKRGLTAKSYIVADAHLTNAGRADKVEASNANQSANVVRSLVEGIAKLEGTAQQNVTTAVQINLQLGELQAQLQEALNGHGMVDHTGAT